MRRFSILRAVLIALKREYFAVISVSQSSTNLSGLGKTFNLLQAISSMLVERDAYRLAVQGPHGSAMSIRAATTAIVFITARS